VTPDNEPSNNKDMEFQNEALPNNVSTAEELACLPDKFLSDIKSRPLKFTYTINKDTETEQHIDLKYALKPLLYSVMFILFYQALEPLAFYGIATTETSFLLGSYNNDQSWGPNLQAAKASRFVNLTNGIARSSALIGGIIADGFLGDFNTIIMAVTCLYLPGLLIIGLTTFPGLLGSDFNYTALESSLYVLVPIGMGFNKACMNAFGAKQLHSILQSSNLEQYFVYLYVANNVGSLLGTTVIPVLAEINLEVAYLIPVCSLLIGLLVLVIFSSRYVKTPPQPTTIKNTFKLIGKKVVCKPLDVSKISNGGTQSDSFVDGVKQLLSIVPVAFLVVPFTIAYNLTYSITIVQGTAMKPLGLLDASAIQCFNPIFKFAYGTILGALFFAWSWLVDRLVKDAYFNHDGSQLSILYQIPAKLHLQLHQRSKKHYAPE
jgi:POT family proton-dependent oligopeptide transporter